MSSRLHYIQFLLLFTLYIISTLQPLSVFISTGLGSYVPFKSYLIDFPTTGFPTFSLPCLHRITLIPPQLKPLNSLPITCRIMPKFLCMDSRLLLLFLSWRSHLLKLLRAFILISYIARWLRREGLEFGAIEKQNVYKMGELPQYISSMMNSTQHSVSDRGSKS